MSEIIDKVGKAKVFTNSLYNGDTTMYELKRS